MIQQRNTSPLASLLQDPEAHVERLRATGRPEVFTVGGVARVVVQDADAYEKMLDALDEAEAVRILHQRLAALDRGEPGIPAAVALEEIRRELGLEKD